MSDAYPVTFTQNPSQRLIFAIIQKNMNTSLPPVSPRTSDNDAAALAERYFGVHGDIMRFASERDENFRITTDTGLQYVLKIANPIEPREITNLQTAALIHLAAKDTTLPVPRVIPATDGQLEVVIDCADGDQRVIRLLSFLQGTPLSQALPTRALRQNVAHCQAAIGKALADFQHPGQSHDLLWDLKLTARLRPLLTHIETDAQRRLLEPVLHLFEHFVEPRLPFVRWQVVHNDFNPYNVLVSADQPPTVTGVLDFGDIVHTPLIIDLAVAMAYNVGNDHAPLAPAIEYVAAFHRTYPLTTEELELLFPLILARLSMVVLLSAWRAAEQPDNKDYLLRNNQLSWQRLEALQSIAPDWAFTQFTHVCNIT